MAFTNYGSLIPFGAPILRREIAANSITVTALDAVVFDTDGFVALATAGDALLGHAIGIGTDKGVGLNTTGAAGAEVGSFVGTFTTASDNETVAKVRAEVDISQFTLYSGDTGATLGTTTSSDERGAYFDLTDEDTIDETSAADTAAQYHSWGPDPSNSTSHVVVNIFESSVFNTA